MKNKLLITMLLLSTTTMLPTAEIYQTFNNNSPQSSNTVGRKIFAIGKIALGSIILAVPYRKGIGSYWKDQFYKIILGVNRNYRYRDKYQDVDNHNRHHGYNIFARFIIFPTMIGLHHTISGLLI